MLLLSTLGAAAREAAGGRHGNGSPGHGASAEHCGDRDDGIFAENPLAHFFSVFLLKFENNTLLEFN